MAQKFERGALIVLILLVLVAALFAIDTHRDEANLLEVIAIADMRTEHLLEQVQSLQDRVDKLERSIR